MALSQITHAGSDNGKLNCDSELGRTKVAVAIDYPVDVRLTSANLTIDKAELKIDGQPVSNWGDEESPTPAKYQIKAVPGYDLEDELLNYVVVEDTGQKFVTVMLHVKEIKGTRKNQKFNANKIEFNFAAALTGIDPRNSVSLKQPIKLNCKFRFAL